MNAAPPPGWYPDPSGQARLRYWDGTRWTERVGEFPPPAVSVTPDSSVAAPKPSSPKNWGIRAALVAFGFAAISVALVLSGDDQAMSGPPSDVAQSVAPTMPAPSNPVSPASPSPEPSLQPTPDPTPPAVIPFGTSGQAGTWDIRVTGAVNFDAWDVVLEENMFNDPPPAGWTMVLVPLSLTNLGASAQTPLGTTGYVVGDATGVERTDIQDPACGVIPWELDVFATVRPGGTIRGNMCFVVQQEDVPTLRLGWPATANIWTNSLPDVEFALR